MGPVRPMNATVNSAGCRSFSYSCRSKIWLGGKAIDSMGAKTNGLLAGREVAAHGTPVRKHPLQHAHRLEKAESIRLFAQGYVERSAAG